MSRISKENLKFGLLIILACIAFLIWTAVFAQAENNKLKVYFFDIGQGSAIFIEAPNKNQVLIDGGPDDNILVKLSQVMPFYDKTIDLIILTHPDSDHLNGLIEVIKRYQIKQVLETGIFDDSANYQIWHSLIKEKNIPLKSAKIGQIIKLGKGLRIDILHPFSDLRNKTVSDNNNSSIVSRLVYNQNSFLFTGDADKKVEWRLVYSGLDLNSDVLAVGHHGSKNSSSQIFLEKVKPEIAVIQVGRHNKYGHPHQEVLQRLSLLDVITLRTDINGDIGIFSDGEKIYIK